MVQLSHPYMITGKIVALTRWTSVGKVKSLLFNMLYRFVMDFPGGSDGKKSACNVVDLGFVPGVGRFHGAGNDNPLQYSHLENPMERGAWWATIHGVAKRQTQPSN